MTRHFFALLALLTGLATFGAPAHASLAEALAKVPACDASMAASTADEAGRCEQGHRKSLPASVAAARAAEPAASLEPAPKGLRLPVLMGIERAFE